MTIAETLATRIAGVTYEALPEEARHWAKVAIMDTVGCILAGADEPCARIAGQVAAIGGANGPCVVFGTQHRVGPMDAAAINGTAAHALDYDDCSDTLGGHPSAPILPALFALAETRGANGRDFIAAYVAGWETETRIARGVNFHHYEKGWHPTATLGVFGATAACAKLLNLPVEKTARALALAATFSSGLKANFGTMTKPLHVGHAARNGLYAALLASEDFTSSTDAIEHRQGFLRVFNGDGNFVADPIVAAWGSPWDIVDPGLAIKQYPCCGSTHPAVDAMLILVRENDLTPALVTRIESQTHPRRFAHTNRPDPRGALDAKFSVQYCLARALVSRQVLIEHFEDGSYDEPLVRSVLGRVASSAWPDRKMDLSEHFGADVQVTLTDGRVLTKSVKRPLGRGPSIPLPPDLLRGKFIDCARRALPDEAANRLHGMLDALETVNQIRTLTEATIPRMAQAADRWSALLPMAPAHGQSVGNKAGSWERRLNFIARLIVACLLIQFVWAGGAEAQKQGGMLRVTHRDNPPSASIHEEATISTDMPFMAVFNNLVVFDPDSKQNRLDRIVPDLATSWNVSEDERTLTFQLRDGVKWHDGKPFTSADVKCTWDMVTGKVDGKMRKNPRKTWWFNIKEITTNGPLEVAFHLIDPQPALLMMLAGGFSPVYPCHVPAAQMRTHPIGTGPFKFVEFKQNESIRLTRNPDYWKAGKPYLDGIEYTIIANRSTAILALESGKFDLTLTGEVTPELVKDVKAQVPQMQCLVQPSNTQGNLLVNRERPPFDDARVRRAMGLAIDRKAFSDILSRGVYNIGGAMLAPPEGQWGWSPEFMATVPGYGADVEKSREEGRAIMRSLGYGPDKMMPLKVSTRNIADYRDASVILIDHLKTVYIQGELEPLDTAVWYARLVRKDYAVGMNVQGTGIDDPDVMFFENYLCGSERNYTAYCNPELEKLFHQQSQMKDQDARRKLVWEIDRKLQEDGARPVVYQSQGGTCWWPHVKGLKLAVNSIYNHWRFEDVWLDR